jgi:hypothetical protein
MTFNENFEAILKVKLFRSENACYSLLRIKKTKAPTSSGLCAVYQLNKNTSGKERCGL